MPDAIRLIVDPPASGAWNMSLDEALLHGVTNAMSPDTLRFYDWSEPTLSLGYFQSLSERAVHPASQNCSVVRRSSGGGAILHHHELTYSLVMKSSERFVAGDLYSIVHNALISVLVDWGLNAELYTQVLKSPRSALPFLCFERRTTGDVVYRDTKVCGSAQRRQGNAILQHGSVIIRRSPSAPELPGLVELSSKPQDFAGIADQWRTNLELRLGRPFSAKSRWNHDEIELAKAWQQERFGNSKWTDRR